MNQNINNLEERTLNYAKSIIQLVKLIKPNYLNKHALIQLLRSSSSVGANYQEAAESQSRKDFIHKISITKKEANETKFWLNLLLETDSAHSDQIHKLTQETVELIKIFGASIATAKHNLQ